MSRDLLYASTVGHTARNTGVVSATSLVCLQTQASAKTTYDVISEDGPTVQDPSTNTQRSFSLNAEFLTSHRKR